MNDKILNWLNIIGIFLILGLFVWGATKTLNVSEITYQRALVNCTPGGILLIVYIFLRVFLIYDLATFFSLVWISISLAVFYFGLIERDEGIKNQMLTFAGAAFGFGAGLPIGKVLSTAKRKTR